MVIVYGISNCDKVKLILSELKKSGLSFELYDFKKTAPTSKNLKDWSEFLNELPVNKRGTTYRNLKTEFESLNQAEQLVFLIKNPSMIKRPIIEIEKKTLAIGYDKNLLQMIKNQF